MSNTNSQIKVFPPPKDMIPNVLVIVKLPKHIYDDFLPYSVEEIRNAVFSITEQEINIHTIHNAKVSVLLEVYDS